MHHVGKLDMVFCGLIWFHHKVSVQNETPVIHQGPFLHTEKPTRRSYCFHFCQVCFRIHTYFLFSKEAIKQQRARGFPQLAKHYSSRQLHSLQNWTTPPLLANKARSQLPSHLPPCTVSPSCVSCVISTARDMEPLCVKRICVN